jgi:photosystem II stability/assembly factor-like uncharacterized protein
MHASGFKLFAVLLLGFVIAGCGTSSTATGSSASKVPTPTLAPTQTATTTPTSAPTKAPSAPGRPVTLSSIHMIDTMKGWALTDTRVLRTTDGANTWHDVTPKYSAQGQIRIIGDFLTTSVAWVAISQGSSAATTPIYHTIDGGATWQQGTVQASPVGVVSLNFINVQDGWLLTSQGAAAGSEEVDIWRSTDSGTTWTKVASANPANDDKPGTLPFGGDKTGMNFVNATTGWVTGTEPRDDFVWLYVTHDGGSTWQHQTLPLPTQGNGVQVVAQPPKFFTASEGILPAIIDMPNTPYTYIYVTHDGGATWNFTSPITAPTNNFDFIDVNHGWAVSGDNNNVLYTTSDGGQHWTKLPSSTNFTNITSLDFVTSQVGWAISNDYTHPAILLKTVDGGATWTKVAPTVS